jgi:hypothetical protein
MVWSVYFWEHIAKLDDPVGALSVHGVNGAWGVLSLGLFADGTYGKGLNGVHLFRDTSSVLQFVEDVTKAPKEWTEVGVTGLFYGNSSQFYAEAIGMTTNILWVLPLSLGFFTVIHMVWGNRSKAEDEIQGLDIPEMGVAGYINEAPITPEGHFSAAASREPRPALVSPQEGRYTVMVEGLDDDSIVKAWSELCLPGRAAPPKEFLIVYPNMTTFKGPRFTFRGGEPEQVRASLGRLLGTKTGKAVRAVLV